MRLPICLRCAWLGFQLREERSRLDELLEHECMARVDFLRARGALLRQNLAGLIAGLESEQLKTRARIDALRKRISRLRAGLPETGSTEGAAHGHV